MQGRHRKAERQMSSWVGVQVSLVGRMGKAGGRVGKVDKTDGLDRTQGKARPMQSGLGKHSMVGH